MYTEQLKTCRDIIEYNGGLIVRLEDSKKQDFFIPQEIIKVFFSFAYSAKLFRRDLVSCEKAAIQRSKAFILKIVEVIVRHRGHKIDICLLVEAEKCYLMVSLFPLIEAINQKKEHTSFIYAEK
jgi:predicted MarR family transcription regulator